MKKIISIFAIIAFATPCVSYGAVNIKKAAPVATKKVEATESATSLLPTVIGLVGSVKSVSAQQQQLAAECVPTDSEVQTVNELVKEWAKIGTVDAATAVSGLGVECTGGFKTYMEDMADSKDSCYEAFVSSEDSGTVWYGFPKASKASICGVDNKNCKNIDNVYAVFEKIPFEDKDYTKEEVEKVTHLKEKLQKCAPDRLKSAKRELYGNFVTQALSGVGQTTGAAGTSSVLQAVSSMGGSGSISSMLPSLSQMAVQSLDK